MRSGDVTFDVTQANAFVGLSGGKCIEVEEQEEMIKTQRKVVHWRRIERSLA